MAKMKVMCPHCENETEEFNLAGAVISPKLVDEEGDSLMFTTEVWDDKSIRVMPTSSGAPEVFKFFGPANNNVLYGSGSHRLLPRMVREAIERGGWLEAELAMNAVTSDPLECPTCEGEMTASICLAFGVTPLDPDYEQGGPENSGEDDLDTEDDDSDLASLLAEED